MNDELAAWLALREASDWSARSERVTRAIANRLSGLTRIRVVDLGTGTGSNLRYLSPRLMSPQQWLLVDRREDLLRSLKERTAAWAGVERRRLVESGAAGFVVAGPSMACTVETRAIDLNLPLDGELWAGRDLVTASALLDLVSPAWIEAVAAGCRAAGAAALFALTYDGRSSFTPAEPEDDHVRDLLNAHQRRDKGLGGPAAGPEAPRLAVQCFEAAGYVCLVEPADWVIGPEARALQERLVEGLAGAAAEQAPDQAGLIADWRERRVAHIASGRSAVVVGHQDLAAWPPT